MPRLAPKEAVEYRFTLGDYERQAIVKPLGDLVKNTDTTLRQTRYLGYAAIGGGVIAAWFIGKGISGAWDDFLDVIPKIPTAADLDPTNPESYWARLKRWQSKTFDPDDNIGWL